MAKTFDPASASDEELAVEADRLAALRTEVRLQQNAVSTEQELRSMLAGASGATREALLIRLGGSATASGSTEVKS